MPDATASSTLSDLKGKTLTGWEETYQALILVERLPEEERNGVRVEGYEYFKESSVKVSFRSLKMLDDWSNLRFRKQLLKGENGSHSRKLDMLSEVHGHVAMIWNDYIVSHSLQSA